MLYILLLVSMAGCLWMALLQLPGLWMLLICSSVYAYLTGGVHLGPWTLGVLVIVALASETLETLAAAGGARRAGASKTAMLFAVIGAVLGGVLLSIPGPVIGTLIGVCLGAFLGAMLAELAKGKGRSQSFRSGWGAATGRLVGTVIKLAGGVVMYLVSAVTGIPV